MASKIFISYSHADAVWLERLHKHLAQLKREGSIEAWYDREITAGGRIDGEISSALSSSNIFLAALSPDFIASSYCYEVELQTALSREARGELIIVPVVFEPCDWLATPLSKFKALPGDGKPVSEFSNYNVALLSIVSELRKLTDQSMREGKSRISNEGGFLSSRSRYRVKRDFDKIDKRDFVNRAYEEIKSFFQSSILELNMVPELEAEYVEIDREAFSCTVINRGMGRAYETVTIRKNGGFGDIDTVHGEQPSRNTSNGGFMVQNDEFEMYFSGGHFRYGMSDEKKLTSQDVAKNIWDDLLQRVGVDYA